MEKSPLPQTHGPPESPHGKFGAVTVHFCAVTNEIPKKAFILIHSIEGAEERQGMTTLSNPN